MATLLVRWRCLWNQTAAQNSVHEDPGVEQIRERRQAELAMGGSRFGLIIGASVPVRPTRRNEGAAAIRKCDKQQQGAAAFYRAHNRQRPSFKRMSLAYDCR
jgi:hypothetical protein